MRPLVSLLLIALALPLSARADTFSCHFVQVCKDNGEGCTLTTRRWTFDTDNAPYSTVTPSGAVQFLATSADEVYGLLTIFSDVQEGRGQIAKFSVHSRSAASATPQADSYHGTCNEGD